MRVYDEVIEFIAAGSTPEQVVAFAPSESARLQVANLIHRQKTTGLEAEETAELEQFLQLEHVMRMAKARARQRMASEGV